MSKKIIGYTTMTPMPRSDFDEEDPKKASYIKNKPEKLKERLISIEENIVKLKAFPENINTRMTKVEADFTNVEADLSHIKEIQLIIEKNIDDLMYEPLSISSFTNDIKVAEIGSTVTDINLSWAFNKAPVSVTLDGVEQTAEASGSVALSGLTITGDTTWTLKGTDERDAVATKETKLQFLNGVYYGVARAVLENSSDLTKVLTGSRARTFTVTAGADEYVWYLAPTRLGSCSFNVGGFTGGFESLFVELTNESGYTEPYTMYRSTNANLGTTTVTVS